MTRLFAVLVALLCACGAYDPSLNGEIAELEQAFGAKQSASWQFGSTTTTAHFQCDRFNAAQTCSVPRTKNIQIAYTPGAEFYAGEILAVAAQFDAGLDAGLDAGWVLSVVRSSDDLGVDQVRLLIQTGNVPGDLLGAIEGYSGVTYTSLVNLTEGVAPGANTPTGQYRTHSGCAGTIDQVDLDAKLNPADLPVGRRHAIGHAIEACLGLGSVNTNHAFYSRRALQPTLSMNALTTGEACRANSFQATNNGDYSTVTSSTCVD
jgi:hypothetical protein